MIARLFRGAAVALVLGAPAIAANADLEPWGEAGLWVILQDPEFGNGCLIQRAFEDGSNIRIGFDATDNQVYVSAFDPAWAGFGAGETHKVGYTLGNDTVQADAVGIALGDLPGIRMFFSDKATLTEIVGHPDMVLSSSGARVMSIDLDGSQEALKQAEICEQDPG
jgi:hypothetical protein